VKFWGQAAGWAGRQIEERGYAMAEDKPLGHSGYWGLEVSERGEEGRDGWFRGVFDFWRSSS